MQINCLSCGHRFGLGKNYDDYEGYVKCSTCGGLLDIKTEEGDVKRVRPGAMPGQASEAMHAPMPSEISPPAQEPGTPGASTPEPAASEDAGANQAMIQDMQRTIAELQQMLLAVTASQPPQQPSKPTQQAPAPADADAA